MDAAKWEGGPKYLTVKVLDFLDRRLAGGIITWKQLAGEMNYSSIDVDKFEADGLKPGQSSTKLLLRDWENKRGGCDVGLLKEHLESIGRRDIVKDLWDEFEKHGREIVGPRSSSATIPQEGQEVVIRGKLYCGNLCVDNFQVITSEQGAGRPTECRKVPVPPDTMISCAVPPEPISSHKMSLDPLHRRDVSVPPELISSHKRSSDPLHRRDVPVPPESTSAYKRNSDPLHRRDVSPSQIDQNLSGGSMESIARKQDSPKNLKKTQSAVFEGKGKSVDVRACPIQRPEVKKEVDSYQTQGDYQSLRSKLPGSVHGVCGPGAACRGKQYLLLSSQDEQDKQWCKKMGSILKKKGHQVSMLHEVPPVEHLKVFHIVDYVLVIYTEKYRREFQTPGTSNQYLFQQMQHEHKRCKGVNHRFIPVYDVRVIRQLPDALLKGDSSEREYILNLLSYNSKHPRNGSCTHSSAPFKGAEGRDCGEGRGALRGTDPALSASEPVVITREHHIPPNHPKPPHSGKKDQKFFWSRNKKGK